MGKRGKGKGTNSGGGGDDDDDEDDCLNLCPLEVEDCGGEDPNEEYQEDPDECKKKEPCKEDCKKKPGAEEETTETDEGPIDGTDLPTDTTENAFPVGEDGNAEETGNEETGGTVDNVAGDTEVIGPDDVEETDVDNTTGDTGNNGSRDIGGTEEDDGDEGNPGDVIEGLEGTDNGFEGEDNNIEEEEATEGEIDDPDGIFETNDGDRGIEEEEEEVPDTSLNGWDREVATNPYATEEEEETGGNGIDDPDGIFEVPPPFVCSDGTERVLGEGEVLGSDGIVIVRDGRAASYTFDQYCTELYPSEEGGNEPPAKKGRCGDGELVLKEGDILSSDMNNIMMTDGSVVSVDAYCDGIAAGEEGDPILPEGFDPNAWTGSKCDPGFSGVDSTYIWNAVKGTCDAPPVVEEEAPTQAGVDDEEKPTDPNPDEAVPDFVPEGNVVATPPGDDDPTPSLEDSATEQMERMLIAHRKTVVPALRDVNVDVDVRASAEETVRDNYKAGLAASAGDSKNVVDIAIRLDQGYDANGNFFPSTEDLFNMLLSNPDIKARLEWPSVSKVGIKWFGDQVVIRLEVDPYDKMDDFINQMADDYASDPDAYCAKYDCANPPSTDPESTFYKNQIRCPHSLAMVGGHIK